MIQSLLMRTRRHWSRLSFLIWFSMVLAGFGCLMIHASTAGTTGEVPRQWPYGTSIALHRNSFNILMFAHPRCPCTRAGLHELAAIIAARPSWNHVRVVFFQPNLDNDGWTNSDIVRQARAMTGVKVVWDEGGTLAASFGVQTSGHVLLYDESGALAFSGGITALRGHEGWNTGRDSVVTLCRGDRAAVTQTPVYGCPLLECSNDCSINSQENQ